MWTGGGSKDEFVPIVENDKGVRRVSSGNEHYAHSVGGCEEGYSCCKDEWRSRKVRSDATSQNLYRKGTREKKAHKERGTLRWHLQVLLRQISGVMVLVSQA